MSAEHTDDSNASTPPSEATRAAQQLLSDNANAWKRLAREGYRRTAEQVRATYPSSLQTDTQAPSPPVSDNSKPPKI